MFIQLKRKVKALAPIVSTLILMAVFMLALTLSLTFVQSNLARRSAENDFNSAKSFMRTVGLQVDDVAWVTGRTDSVRYTVQNGDVNLLNPLLNYTIEVGRVSEDVLWLQTNDVDFDSGFFEQTTRIGAGTAAYIELTQYDSPLSIDHYVDNNISDVDQSQDKGFHSGFVNQQQGPDSNYDLLTEQTSLFEQVVVTDEQSTSNMEWTDVSGASVSFTPSSTSEEWLIFVTADIRSNRDTEDQARFRYDINGVTRGETGVQQSTTSATPIDPYNVYFHFSRVTGTTAKQTIKLQFQASSGATAYTRNVHILCIRLDWAGLEYIEVNGDTLITGDQTLATLQFNPSLSGDYIVAYCASISELPIDAGVETWLDIDSGTSLYPDAWATPNTARTHTDRDQFEPHGVLAKTFLDTSLHTFSVQAKLRTIGDTSTARDVRIVAFRVDAFDLLEYDEDTAVSSTTGANTVRSVVNTADPGEEREYFVLAGIQTISSGTSSRESGGIEIDDVFVQRKGDQRLSYAPIARIASHYANVVTSSTSFKVETTYGSGGIGSDTIYSKQSVIYVLKLPHKYELDLEVQFTNVPFNLENESLCIYAGSLGNEDLRVDYWNGGAWETLDTRLSENSWNNYTIVLNSSTYTIRFKGSNEINDLIQDSWEIDAVLLVLRSENHTNYYSTGTFTSQKEDTGGASSFDQLSWSETLSSGTEISFRIRTASTEGGLETAVWYGPIGTADYYTDPSGTTINSIHNGDQWIQYKAYLSTLDPIQFSPELLDVSITYRGIEYNPFLTSQVGVLFFNVPLHKYALDNEYYESINPTSVETLVFHGTSALVTRTFAVQKNPIVGEEPYIRAVVAPVIRYITSYIASPEQNTNYIKLYLPNLVLGETPRASQSITLTAKSIQVYRESNVESIRITVSFPQGSNGFNNDFFHFPLTSQIISVPDGTELEVYISQVEVDIGL